MNAQRHHGFPAESSPPGHSGALQGFSQSGLTEPLHQCSRSQECKVFNKSAGNGPRGSPAQMSFYIFMWNVITFGHDRGCPVTAIRAFMVLRGIRVFGDTCLQLKATGYADSRSHCKILRKGLASIASGSLVERAGIVHRPKSGQIQEGPLWRDNPAWQFHSQLPWHGIMDFRTACQQV